MNLTPDTDTDDRSRLITAQQQGKHLYTWNDLYDNGANGQYSETYEYLVYQAYRREGQPEDADWNIYEALAAHDTAIGFALREFLNKRKNRKAPKARGVVAIMGGHRLTRDDPTYEAVVDLARKLAKKNFLVMSGGGPGAMEAAHLGALTHNYNRKQVAKFLDQLKTQAEFPKVGDLGKLLHEGNNPTEVKRLLGLLDVWLRPAIQIRAQVDAAHKKVPIGESLSIPTWHYGHEPPTPFASVIAKFFQNSLREDKLLAHAQSGIVYVKGGAGTVQEIFQDAAQNYYTSFEYFSPMVFFSIDPQQWTSPSGPDDQSSEYRPVRPLLEAVFARAPLDVRANFERYVQYLTQPEAVLELFDRFEQSVTKKPKPKRSSPLVPSGAAQPRPVRN